MTKQKDSRHPAARMRHDNPHFGRGGAHQPKKGKGMKYNREEQRRTMRDAEREK